MTGLTFYWGAASGSARKALQRLNEPNVAINYATKLNEPWEGIDRLLIDSGGYSYFSPQTPWDDYQTTDREYLEYVAEHEPELFALRDYPCEPDIRAEFGRTVAEHQQMTTERHRRLLDLYDDLRIDAGPMAVVQGWHPDQYLDHLDQLRAAKCLTRHVAIGTLCGRESRAVVRDVVTAVRDELGEEHALHAFGVKLDAFREPRTIEAIDTADSNAYDADERRTRTRNGDTDGRTWQDVAFYYLKHKRKLRRRVGGNGDPDPSWFRDDGQLGLEELVEAAGGGS